MNNIALFSVPRSGSTWLGQLLNSHPSVLYRFQPNFAYSFEPSLQENSTKQEIAKFYKNLIETTDPFVNAEITISSKEGLHFKKETPLALVFKETHYINVVENLIKNSDTKVVGLIRSPFSVINSWLKIPKEFDPQWKVEDEWEMGQSKNQDKPINYFGYNKWKEATELFVRLREEYPNQFYLLSYEELLKDTEDAMKKVFDFSGLNFSDQTESFVKKSYWKLNKV